MSENGGWLGGSCEMIAVGDKEFDIHFTWLSIVDSVRATIESDNTISVESKFIHEWDPSTTSEITFSGTGHFSPGLNKMDVEFTVNSKNLEDGSETGDIPKKWFFQRFDKNVWAGQYMVDNSVHNDFGEVSISQNSGGTLKINIDFEGAHGEIKFLNIRADENSPCGYTIAPQSKQNQKTGSVHEISGSVYLYSDWIHVIVGWDNPNGGGRRFNFRAYRN